jgi:hypothetical protein
MERPEKPDECDACHFETKALTYYGRERPLRGEREHKWLCDLCASTNSGNTLEYPEQWPDRSADVLRTVCYVGNVILAAVRDRKG